jgi:hypothetical protein
MDRRTLVIEVPDLAMDEGQDAQLVEVKAEAGSWWFAHDSEGTIYLDGDLHPQGGPVAMQEAMAEGVPHVPQGIRAYFPHLWLVQKAMAAGDVERMQVMNNVVRWIRSQG